MERIKSYIPGFEELSKGGIPKNSNIIVGGAPGSGKTTFSLQIAFENAKREEKKTIVFTTVSEPPFKMIQFLNDFAFFDRSLLNTYVFVKDISTFIQNGQKEELLEFIQKSIQEIRPDIVIIDSFKSLSEVLFDSFSDSKKYIFKLTAMLSVWQITSLFVGEYILEDVERFAEFSITDGIIYLKGTNEPTLQKYYIQILKLRGSDFLKGEQHFEITPEGIVIYLRLRPDVERMAYEIVKEHFEVPELLPILPNGMRKQTATVISGPTGSGKTILMLKLIERYLLADGRHRALFMAFEEFPELLMEYAKRLDIGIEKFVEQKRLKFLFLSPVELDIDKLGYRIQKELDDRLDEYAIAIDSVSSFRYAQRDDIRYREFLWSLMQQLKYGGATMFFTYEVENLFKLENLAPDMKISLIADNAIALRYKEEEGRLQKIVAAVKARGSVISDRIYRFDIIDGQGIKIQID